MQQFYKYTGTISQATMNGKRVESVILSDLRDNNKAPTRLEILGDMREYIYELECTDAEERYIASDFYYDSNLFLRRIEIPSTREGIPAKVIVHGFTPYQMEIFGKAEFIETSEPEPLSPEEYSKYLDYKISN